MRPLILAAAIALTASAPAMAQGVNESIDVGGWVVRRTMNADKSQICTTATVADDKTGVGFAMTSGLAGYILLIDPKAGFTPGSTYALEYKIDSAKTVKAKATASSPGTLLLPLGGMAEVAPIFTAIEKGNDIHLETDDKTYDYGLTGSKKAFAALENCVKAIAAS